MVAENHIYAEIKNAIFNKKISLNQQLNEQSLSEAFKVSRTPIRAVLQKLTHEKILYNIPNKGTFIYLPNKKEMDDIFQLRIVMEKKAAEIACEKGAAKEFEDLENVIDKEEKEFKKGEYGKGIGHTADFHQGLLKLSNNSFMIAYNEELINISNVYLAFHDTATKECPMSPDEHRAILNYLKKRELSNVLNMVDYHFESIKKHLKYQQNISSTNFTDIFMPYKTSN